MTPRAPRLALAALSAAVSTLATPVLAQAPAPAAPVPCTPEGKVSYVCGLMSVEDMVVAPGGRWIFGSALVAGQGGLYVIDAKNRTAKKPEVAVGKPRAPFTDCQAPPEIKAIRTHGLELRPEAPGLATLFAVNHGGRESIEVYGVDTRGAEPRLTWTGCLMMPKNASGNAIAALPGGALAVTKFQDADDDQAIVHILGGQITGLVYIWTPGPGFREVPGTKVSGANGLVASPDGRWLYINDYGNKAVLRVAASGGGPVIRTPVDFHPDNLRWAADGKIIATGQYITLETRAGLHGWAAVKIDPQTMAQTPYLKVPGTAAFDNGTTTLQVGRDLWIGTYRGDRVAVIPAP